MEFFSQRLFRFLLMDLDFKTLGIFSLLMITFKRQYIPTYIQEVAGGLEMCWIMPNVTAIEGL